MALRQENKPLDEQGVYALEHGLFWRHLSKTTFYFSHVSQHIRTKLDIHNDNCRICICVTTFNSGDTIGEVIHSIKNQDTYLDSISQVVVTANETDNRTMCLVKSIWRGIDAPPLEIIRHPSTVDEYTNVNSVYDTLSKRFDWVLRVHADNPVKSYWLAYLIPRILNCSSKVATICSSYDSVKVGRKITPGDNNTDRNYYEFSGNLQVLKHTLLAGCWWHNSSSAIRLKAYQEIGHFETELPQKCDWDWFLRLIDHQWSIEYIPRVLFEYRERAQSESSINFQKDADIREGVVVVSKYIEKVGKQLTARIFIVYMRFSLRRILRSTLSFDFRRLMVNIKTLGFVTKNLFFLLQK